jgi:hypothetical protein
MISEENTNQEQIQVEIPEMKFNIKDVKWYQQGYELIGLASNGMRFGTRIDDKLRLIGVDENNKPIFKRIDM